MKRGKKQKLNGDEMDAVYKYPLCVFYNITGLRKRVKTILNKRSRQEIKKSLRLNKKTFIFL